MEEPDTIVDVVERFFRDRGTQPVALNEDKESAHRHIARQKVVVTAGGTIERIDPVRYITNDSSGKMGFAIAKAGLGADVHLIAAHTDEAPPVGIKVERVESAQDMYDAVRAYSSIVISWSRRPLLPIIAQLK